MPAEEKMEAREQMHVTARQGAKQGAWQTEEQASSPFWTVAGGAGIGCLWENVGILKA